MNICLQTKFKHRPKFKRRKAQRQSSRLIFELGNVIGKFATNLALAALGPARCGKVEIGNKVCLVCIVYEICKFEC
jgi:hypothetical protein